MLNSRQRFPISALIEFLVIVETEADCRRPSANRPAIKMRPIETRKRTEPQRRPRCASLIRGEGTVTPSPPTFPENQPRPSRHFPSVEFQSSCKNLCYQCGNLKALAVPGIFGVRVACSRFAGEEFTPRGGAERDSGCGGGKVGKRAKVSGHPPRASSSSPKAVARHTHSKEFRSDIVGAAFFRAVRGRLAQVVWQQSASHLAKPSASSAFSVVPQPLCPLPVVNHPPPNPRTFRHRNHREHRKTVPECRTP